MNRPLNLHLHIPKEGSKCLPIWCFPVLVSSGHWWQADANLSYIHVLKHLLRIGRIFWGRNESLIGSSAQSFKMLTGGSHCMLDVFFILFQVWWNTIQSRHDKIIFAVQNKNSHHFFYTNMQFPLLLTPLIVKTLYKYK